MISQRNTQVLKSLAQRTLVAALCLSLSGIAPGLHAIAHAGDAFFDFKAVSAPGLELTTDLQAEVRRARRPGTPGTLPGTTSADDVTALEARFDEWMQLVANELVLPVNPKDAGPDLSDLPANLGDMLRKFAPKELPINLLEIYLRALTLLTELKISMGFKPGPEWMASKCLPISEELADSIPESAGRVQGRTGEQYSRHAVDELVDGGRCIRLGLNFVHGMQLGRLADLRPKDPNAPGAQDGFLVVLKYLALHQQLSNLNDLRFVAKNQDIAIPRIPDDLPEQVGGDLLEQFSMLAFAPEMFDELNRTVMEPASRVGLMEAFDDATLKSLPVFATDTMIAELVDAMGTVPGAKTDVTNALKERLTTKLDASLVRQEVLSGINAEPGRMESADDTKLVSIISKIAALAQATVNTAQLKVMDNEGLFPDLTQESAQAAVKVIDRRVHTYQIEIRDSIAGDWITRSHSVASGTVYESRRRDFIKQLLRSAPQVLASNTRAATGASIDMRALGATFAPDLLMVGASETASNWYIEIVSAGDYMAARAKYNDLIALASNPSFVVNSVVDPAKVREYAKTQDFTPNIKFSKRTPPQLAEDIRSRIAAQHKLNLEHLVACGDWLGFHTAYLTVDPSLMMVLNGDKNKERRATYFKNLDEMIRTHYPILGIEVLYSDRPNVPAKMTPLAHVLAAFEVPQESRPVNPADPTEKWSDEYDPLVESAAPYVDEALKTLEISLHNNMATIAAAKSIEELDVIFKSSAMLAMAAKGFPEYQLYTANAREQMLSPAIVDQVMRKYLSPAMTYGVLAFIAGLAIKGFTGWVFPRTLGAATKLISWTAEPMMAGFHRYLMAIMVADVAYQVHEFAHASDQSAQAHQFAYCAAEAEGGCFISAKDVADYDAKEAEATRNLVLNIVLNVAAFKAPKIIGYVVGKFRGDITIIKDIAADRAAFERLGIKTLDFSKVEPLGDLIKAARRSEAEGQAVIAKQGLKGKAALRAQKLVKRVCGMETGPWEELLRSYDRLSIRRLQGKAYRFFAAQDRLAIESAFKVLDLDADKVIIKGGVRMTAWDQIDEAVKVQNLANPGTEARTKVSLASNYLKALVKETPALREADFVPLTKYERKLMNTLGRTPDYATFWDRMAREIMSQPGIASAAADAGAL